ncbi:lipoyl synthase [Helcobacillus massiliensis]|uniref:lipoyl synthase n=1 Tax=Helcobacillus massiliensis TaxID=521392 RepID=UPI002553DD4A|nr:lipoyl synthase [Helcobacillus massiliensis]MDK7741183.1 lipoyl synthase [Helcobacillus massiliensis]WOO93989.1 lipoyl synthase [Helcobacillus massiliensis]
MTVASEGRKLRRVEARNAETPIERKPSWIKTTAKMGPEYAAMKQRVHGQGLHTVCEEAGCPNIFECWEDREATFLIGGDTCTRRCDFCDIATGKPMPVDPAEPFKVAMQVKDMGLRYSTITGVARDDLSDGAAGLFAETCKQIHKLNPGTGVELLIDDIKGDAGALEKVFEAKPEVFAHNLETVPRIFKQIRPAFRYQRSLDVLRQGKDAGMITKSNLILGMGETTEEIIESMQALHDAGTDILTITQYLRPSKLHHPIDRWVKPMEFVDLSKKAYEIGFLAVMAGPMVRSSYRAGRLWAEAMNKLGRPIPEELKHLDTSTPATQEAEAVVERMKEREERHAALEARRAARRAADAASGR